MKMNLNNTQELQKNKTYALTATALMTAVTCILAPLSVPIGPVPISLTNFVIFLSLYLLNWKKGTDRICPGRYFRKFLQSAETSLSRYGEQWEGGEHNR